MIDFLYPGGKPKALTFSYDDGAVFDRRLTELFRRCGLKGTFHLNSGRLGGHFGPMEYIRPDEVRELYRGQEVACHGVDHLFPDRLSPSGLAHELYGDRCALEQLTGAPVTGLSYAFGVTSDAVAAAAQAYGFEYARTVADNGIFAAYLLLHIHRVDIGYRNNPFQHIAARFIQFVQRISDGHRQPGQTIK